MLVEKSLKEALNKHIAGREVLVMSPGAGSIVVDKLEDYLGDCRFLVEVPAVGNEEFEQAVQKMIGKKPSDYKPQYATTEKIAPPPAKSEVRPLPAKNNGISEADKERIRELHNYGKSITEIAEETGIKYNAVWYQVKNRIKADPLKATKNTDRKHCKTCRYRGIKNGCDFIQIVGHSRGCSVEACSVYEKGARLNIGTTASDRLGV